MNRCEWGTSDALMVAYHDTEWGTPLHDDQTLFEFLILEGAQAGLSWQTILNKREAYRKAFDNFDIAKVAKYGDAKIAELLSNAGIVRNRLKVNAAITNAHATIDVQNEHGSLDAYLWSFVGGKPKVNRWKQMSGIPAVTPESETMSKALLKLGFKFVGPTIMYAFMQATGMVNDHILDCFRYQQLAGKTF